MGVYLCYPEEYYTIKTGSEGVISLCLAAMYLGFEVFYTVKSIQLFKRNKNIPRNFALICFYVLIHLSLVAAVFYHFGGVLICYGRLMYNLLNLYSDTFGRMLILLLLYRLDLYLHHLNNSGDKKSKLGLLIIVISIGDAAVYLVLIVVSSFRLAVIGYAILYVTCIYSAIIFVFLYILNVILKFIHAYPNVFKKKQWYALLIVICSYLVLRLIAMIVQIVEASGKGEGVWLIAATMVLNLVGTVIPCLTAIWFMLQTFTTSEKRESQ